MRQPRSARFALMFTSDEVTEIDSFRFSHRIGSRAGAVRRLIECGLVAEKAKGPAEAATSPSHGSSNSLQEKANERQHD